MIKESIDKIICETIERKADEYVIGNLIQKEHIDKSVKKYLIGMSKGNQEDYKKYWNYYCMRK